MKTFIIVVLITVSIFDVVFMYAAFKNASDEDDRMEND